MGWVGFSTCALHLQVAFLGVGVVHHAFPKHCRHEACLLFEWVGGWVGGLVLLVEDVP